MRQQPRRCLSLLLAPLLLGVLGGCIRSGPSTGKLEKVYGRRGIGEGRLNKPRAMAIDDNDEVYLVDMTGRIQVFSREGEFQRSWRTPNIENGKPCGLSFDQTGNLMVADTHYYQILFYRPDGTPLPDLTIGGKAGLGPGEFAFVTDAVQDSLGNYYVSEYGDNDRIQKFSPKGEHVLSWGTHGLEPGNFHRPQNLAVDAHDNIWVVDACNHRVQVFNATGGEVKLLRCWGTHGKEPGQLSYPYDLVLDGKGHVYISEFGNHRVQKFTLDGESLAVWGVGGKREGELQQPWALGQDTRGRIHVLDTYNHRVQRIRL